MRRDSWGTGFAYESYMGRWSRLVADEFVDWIGAEPGGIWLDVGCGTGVLTSTILATADPASVKGIDRSESFVHYARAQIPDRRATFAVSDAEATEQEDSAFDVVVSGLALNFVERPDVALADSFRVVRSGGTVGVYVWDYGEGMEMTRYFWDSVMKIDPKAAELDEGKRFPICNPSTLEQRFRESGLADVEVRAIDIPTVFVDFEDYWSPFLGGQGPAPTYLAGLSGKQRMQVREQVETTLPTQPNGSIALSARSWAARGLKPDV